MNVGFGEYGSIIFLVSLVIHLLNKAHGKAERRIFLNLFPHHSHFLNLFVF
jgi:hypothetical protein